MDPIEKFIRKVSYKFPKGYPDLNDYNDVILLENLINQYGIKVQLNEISLSPAELKKPFPPRNEFHGLYNDRGEKFLEKIEKKEKFELNNGQEITIDIEASSDAINFLKNKDYAQLGGRNKLFKSMDGESYSLSQFKKTKEFGSGKGFGGGALATSIQESSQCVVNSISYLIKKGQISEEDLTEENINKGYELSDVSNSIEEVKDFILNQSTWKDTFIGTANILFKNFYNPNFEQHRGSDFVNKIYEAYKIAKKAKNSSLNSDKWNPADIWLVDKSILEMAFPTTIEDLNGTLADLFADKKLIGVSLKKTDANPKLSVYNLSLEEKEGFNYVGYDSKPTNNNTAIEYSDGSITFRTFNFATNFAGEIKGKKAAHGKIGQGPINDILDYFDINKLPSPKELQEAFSESNEDLILDFHQTYNKIVESISLEDFRELVESKDLNYLVSKYLSTKLTSHIENQDKATQDEIISDIIRYASSSTRLSSVFVKVS